MCNLYRITTTQEAMRRLFDPLPMNDFVGNLPLELDVYPDRIAPIVRMGMEGMELRRARWGLPTPPQYLVGKKTDRGVTNLRDAKSPHWRRWQCPEYRALSHSPHSRNPIRWE